MGEKFKFSELSSEFPLLLLWPLNNMGCMDLRFVCLFVWVFFGRGSCMNLNGKSTYNQGLRGLNLVTLLVRIHSCLNPALPFPTYMCQNSTKAHLQSHCPWEACPGSLRNQQSHQALGSGRASSSLTHPPLLLPQPSSCMSYRQLTVRKLVTEHNPLVHSLVHKE